MERSKKPHHDFEDFRKCCEKGRRFVGVLEDAIETAFIVFGIDGEDAILHAVAHSLTITRFHKPDTSEHWRRKGEDVHIDVYHAKLKGIEAYFAFQKLPNGKWQIKSLKEK